ncbi:MFS transporter [Pseudonocardia kujensis]|uniref:MFS transporter n=1 Tax=Pseudonocardia kujensis TaxID=1128675 RepID=UPI001E3329AE|nr:MFS transporter [Pseudonocardia kujensis]MCE0761316.1 MFS transporter [Pseudonocardia kujensis]
MRGRGRRAVPGWVALWIVVFAVAYGTNVPTPLLLHYRATLGFSPTALTTAFGVYAAGLVPALLLAGPLSDAVGRRRVVVPFVALALLSTLAFLAVPVAPWVLFAGRFLQGAVSGVVFSVGTAWLGELMAATGDGGARAARLTAVALGGGWALGPLVSGLLGQWAAGPAVLPYVVHVALMLPALALLPRVPETLPPEQRRGDGPLVNLGVPPGAGRAFGLVVVPIAIGVFAFAATAVNVLPLELEPVMPGIGVAVTGLVAGLTMGTGVVVQPLVRRLGTTWAGAIALALGAAGIALGLVADVAGVWPLVLPVSVLLGLAYGICLATGLTLVARLADPAARGALTGTFYACSYLGFFVPLLLAAVGGGHGFVPGLAGLAVVSALAAAWLASPAARALVTSPPPTATGRAVPRGSAAPRSAAPPPPG